MESLASLASKVVLPIHAEPAHRLSGRLWARVGPRSGAAAVVDATVRPATGPGTLVDTDEWNGYQPLGRRGRGKSSVDHERGEGTRGDDGQGVREVECNTREGIGTGRRNFLRPFRGVNKAYLEQYVMIFQWASNLKAVTDEFLRVLLGCSVTTNSVT